MDLEAERPPDVLAPVTEVHGEVVPSGLSPKIPAHEPLFAVRPADRPDQRFDPRLPEALLEVQLSGRMADDWVDHASPFLSAYRPTPGPFW